MLKNMSKPDVKNSIWKELWEYIKMIIFVVAVVLVVNNFLLINARVPSESMENTIMTGDRFFGNRLAYLFDDPERFDIVVFKYPDDESQLFVKRVIGLPGETVEIKDGKVYINEQELTDDIYGITDYIDIPGIAEEPLTLKADEYFCLGDNRPESFDSRYAEVGPVHRADIVGKVWIRIWPLKKFGAVE